MKFDKIEITGEDVRAFFRWLKEIWVRLYVPRNKKNKVGIVIAITTENIREKIRLQNDLILNLRKYLDESKIPSVFNVIPLPEKHAIKVCDYQSSLKYLRRTRSHLIIYGTICERKVKGLLNYVFRLEGTVIHRPILQILSDRFSREFASLMPRRWLFPTSEELLGFEITKQWIGVVTKYVVGIAAYVSGDFDLAYDIFSQMKKETGVRKNNNIPVINEINKRLPLRFVEVSNAICERLYFAYTRTRNIFYIQKLNEYLNIMQKYDPDDYNAHNLRAIYLFLVKRNVSRAIDELKKIQDRPDTTWRYNLAFLYAYQGQLDKAKRQYDKAFQGYVPDNIINETEVFISGVITAEPNKYQLYFARGYINFKAKKDYLLAKKDFTKFIEKNPNDMYQIEIKLVKTYIEQIERELEKIQKC